MRLAIRLVQLVRTVILARLLVPEDFGLMAIATITLLLMEAVTRTGFRNALVQFEGDIADYLGTAWTLEALRGMILGGIGFLAAPFIGSFFGSADAVPIIQVVALSASVSGFTNMGLVGLDRELRFDRVFRFEVSQRVAEVLVSVIAAFVLRNVWALVLGVLAGSIVRVVVSFVLVPNAPRVEIDRHKAGELYRYGKWIYGSGLLGFVGGELDDILVGRLLGEAPLGLYRMAYNLSQSVVTEIAQTTNQVVFSAFSRLKEAGQRLGEGLAHSVHFVAFLAFPTAMGFIVAGHEITLVLLGRRWLDIVPALQVLAVAGALKAVTAVISVMFEGAGQPRLATRYFVIRVITLGIFIYPAIRWFGIVGAAGAVLGSSLITDALTLRAAKSFAGALYPKLLRGLIWPLLNSILMAAAVVAVIAGFDGIQSWLRLVMAIGAGGLTYGLAVWISSSYLGYQEPRYLLNRLRG